MADCSPNQSSCCSDIGDVLIRSTQVRGPGPGSVQITVQKLRSPPVQPPALWTERQQQQPKPRQMPDRTPSLRAAGACQAERVKKPGRTKENRRPAAAESSPDRKLSAGTHSDGPDMLTSHFAAGSRGVVLAALKQRSCGASPRSSQVAPGPRTGSTRVQLETGLSSGCHGEESSAGVVKTSSHLEEQVSRLTEGVQQLLQADRGRGLSQQTLHHLETLHVQQLQLQSQLLGSALGVLIGHAPVISDLTASGHTPHLQVTHLDTTENVLSKQQRSSSATRTRAAGTVETGPVAMATPLHDRWSEQTSDDRHQGGVPLVSTVTQPAAGCHLQSSANLSQAAVMRANETLREPEMLLKPDSLKTTRSGPDHHQSQKNHSQKNQSQKNQSQWNQSQQNQSQPYQSQQNQSQQNQSQQKQSQQNQSQLNQSQQNQSQWNQSQQYQSQQNHGQLNHSQQYQSQQNQCQENQSQQYQSQRNPLQSRSQQSISQQSHQDPFQQIQSQQNPTQANQLHSHSWSQQPQSQTLSQSVLVQRRPVVPSMLEEAGQVLRQVRRQKKVLEENLEACLRARTGEVLHCQLEALAANRDWTEEVRIKKTVDAWITTLTKDIQAELTSEDAAMTSQQRTVGSHAHTGRGRRVSALRTTGSKAAWRGNREQEGVEPDRATGESYLTRLYGRAPYEGLRRTLKKSPYLRFSSPASPLSRKPRPRLVESVTGVKVKSCKTQTSLAPPPTSQHHDIIALPHLTSFDPADLTVTPAGSPSIPRAIPLVRPRIDSSRCLAERQQEVTSPPTTRLTCSMVGVADGAPSLRSQEEEQQDAPPPPVVDIIEEEEESIFPGNDFLSVADVIQEEVGLEGEEGLELDGGPSPPLVLYQGPVFPPQTRSALPAPDQAAILDLNLQRNALENRLVEWVEQKLMSRMISEMYHPPPLDPVQNESTDQSESREQSVTSVIGSGMQLLVDPNTAVDSALVRQLVGEVLTEHIALMLGERDSLESGPGPGPGPEPEPVACQEDNMVPLVPTPVPTPLPSPATPSREALSLTTPPPSEPASLLDESPQPITAPEHVTTPTPSPEPAHSPIGSAADYQAPPHLTWAELSLDEDRPKEHLETHPQPQVMSAAEEEPPLSSLSPPHPCGPDPRPESQSSSSEDSSSSTETALRHISEGELLISANQPAAVTGSCYLTSVHSWSSSLLELQEMDFDPPSEGQVKGHDLLLTKMEQRDTRGQGSWRRKEQEEEEVSLGEVRDNWTTKPHRTTNPQSTASPGQCADVSEASFDVTNHNLMAEPISALTSDLQADLSPPPHPAEQVDPGPARRMEVHLPSVTPEEEVQEEVQQVSAATDTADSSTDDLF